MEVNTRYNPFHAAPLAPDRNWEKLYQDFERDGQPALPEVDAPTDALPPTDVSTPTPLFSDTTPAASAPCFQYKNRYILTTLKSGLAMIDQHRAHVRILYDRYIRQVRSRTAVSQQMLFPELVEFTPTEASLLPSLLDDLHRLGFELSPMGGNSYSVTAIPTGLRDVKASELLKELVDGAADTVDAVGDEMAETLTLSLARSAAIRPGRPLSTEEMEEMVATLFSTESHRITPDGRPVLILLTDDELTTRFK